MVFRKSTQQSSHQIHVCIVFSIGYHSSSHPLLVFCHPELNVFKEFVKSSRGWLSSIFESNVFFQLRPCYLLDENQTLCRLQGTQGRRICTQKKLLRQGTSVLKQELVSEIISPNADGSYRFMSNQGGLDEFHSN